MPVDDTPPPRRRAVLDPEWEVALRAGQEAEGHSGSVEDELAIVHLLRHAREPQPLHDVDLDRMWGDLDAALEQPRPASGWRAWLQRPWLVFGSAGVATVAAAVLVMVWIGPTEGPDTSGPETIAQGTDPQLSPEGMAATIEAQFAVLEPEARAAVVRSVDEQRSGLRDELLVAAQRADGRTMGGAP